MVTIEVEGRRKKKAPKLRNGCGDQEKPNNTKNVEIAQRLWRHPIEHTDDSPQIPPYPLGQIRQKEAISKPRIAQKVMATRGAKKRNVATKGNRTNYSTLVATKEAEKQNELKLRDGCGDQGRRKKRHAKKSCVKIALKVVATKGCKSRSNV